MATHCNTWQHTATHGNTLQHMATHCNIWQHTAKHGNTLQDTATRCTTLSRTLRIMFVDMFKCVAVCCRMLQCVAVCCSALQRDVLQSTTRPAQGKIS